MTRKIEFSTKIQLLANRVRCSVCNADSSECVFAVSGEIRFRKSYTRATLNEPVYEVKNNKTGSVSLRINKTQNIDMNQVLTKICLKCGNVRKTSILE